MRDRLKLSHLDDALGELDYPIDRETTVAATDDVTLELPEGEENLGEIVADSSDDRFDSADDLASEIRNLLPRHAVGDPFQSEGEG